MMIELLIRLVLVRLALLLLLFLLLLYLLLLLLLLMFLFLLLLLWFVPLFFFFSQLPGSTLMVLGDLYNFSSSICSPLCVGYYMSKHCWSLHSMVCIYFDL